VVSAAGRMAGAPKAAQNSAFPEKTFKKSLKFKNNFPKLLKFV
jgi:hypothetical protein